MPAAGARRYRMLSLLQHALKQGDIRDLDLETGLFLERMNGRRSSELLLAASLASAAVSKGHTCLPLDQAPGLLSQKDPKIFPNPDCWRDSLLASGVVGEEDSTAPLILDGKNRLYLYRFYHCEKRVADSLKARATALSEVDTEAAAQVLGRLFPERKDVDDQLTAAALALLKPLLIISGGPGTGKTWVVARILWLLQTLSQKPLRIGLAAPTGKAAARLQQSLQQAGDTIGINGIRLSTLTTRTLHRLLGFRPDTDEFKYNEYTPLPLDLLVVDEASMIDLALMDALLKALPPNCRLLLLGDRYQLASVEAGCLFGDLCADADNQWPPDTCERLTRLTDRPAPSRVTSDPAIHEAVVTLRTGFRFHDTSGIGTLATAVNSGRMAEVEKCIQGNCSDLLVAFPDPGAREQWLQQQIIEGYRAMLEATTVEEAFAAMEKFRILCAVRRGSSGVEGINLLAERALIDAELISGETDRYPAKPIIIRRNHYQMQLYNGDTGILRHDDQGRLKAWFMLADGRLHPFTPARLPEHEAAWAITIHKAQGSEFDRTLLVLPEEDSRVLSRELLYTAITRAGKQLVLCADPKILAIAVGRRTQRFSGLADRLQAVK